MAYLEDLNIQDNRPVTGAFDSQLDQLGLVKAAGPVESEQPDGMFKGLGSDISYAVTHPGAVAAKMKAGVTYALSGIQEMRAHELERVGSAGIYGSEYAAETKRSAEDLAQQTKDINAGLSEDYKIKSKAGQFLSDLTQSAPAMLAGIGAGILGGPQAGFAVGTSLGAAQVFGQKYKERVEMGDSHEAAVNSSLIHALAEAGTEALGIKAFTNLFKTAKAGAKLTPALIRESFTEGAEEVISGLIQGTEDSWRGEGQDPAGIAGALEYFKSGKFLEEAALNFAGGALMSGVTSAAIMKPIQMSYKPKAIEAVQAMDQAIKDAEASQVDTIDIAGVATPVGEVRTKMEETIEAFGIKPEEWVAPTVGQANQDQERFDSAVSGIKEQLSSPPVAEPNLQEQLQKVVEPEQAVPEVQTVEPAPERASYKVGSVTAFGKVHSLFADTVDGIYKTLDWQPTVELYDKGEITPEDLVTLQRSEKQIASIGSARVMVYKDADGQSKYRIVGDFAGKNQLWQLSTVMHEAIGHITDYEFYDKAPAQIKETVEAGFNSWLKTKQAPAFLSEDIIEQVKDPAKVVRQITAKRANESEQAYRDRMFREFKAHQISKAMQKRPEVRSVIERFWAKLYKKLEGLYKSFKENYLDIASNVGTMDEFVEWLYSERAPQTITEGTKESVQNFNTKLDPFVESVFNSIFEIVNGKRVIKDSWRVRKIFSNGKIGRIPRADLQKAGFHYKELKDRTVVMRGKDSVLFTIPWDSSRGLSQKSARMVATNIRDLFVMATIQRAAFIKPVKRASAYGKLQKIINDRAEQMAAEEGISVNQAKLNILSGQGSAFSKYTPGIKGTPSFTKNQQDRTLIPFENDIKRFQTEFPGLFQELYGDIQEEMGDTRLDSAKLAVESQVEEPTPDVPVISVTDEVTDIVEGLVEELYNKKKPSEQVRNFDTMVEKVIFYFDYKGKDYIEIDAGLRNLVGAVIKDKFQELSGEQIQKNIRNKSVAIDQVRELNRAGMDTTIDEIELMQMARDMGMLEDDLWIGPEAARRVGKEKVLGFFQDPIDDFKKAFIVDREFGWKPNRRGETDIGNGKVPVAWRRRAANNSLFLEEVFNAPDIFAAYPRLRGVKLKFMYNRQSGLAGLADWDNFTITLNMMKDPAIVKETMLHELQHIIQAEENWAGGTSPKIVGSFQRYIEAAGEEQARRAVALYYLTDDEIQVGFQDSGMYYLTDVDVNNLYWADSRSDDVNLSAISTVEEHSNDELTFASYAMIFEDDLKIRIKKNVKARSRAVRTSGPYAEILKENLKPKKVKVKKSASMEQIQKRQQRLADFISKMDVIKARAEKTGKSMAEVMQTAGFEAAEIRKAITKYYAAKSKFSQNEMIIRLAEVAGLINEDTGRVGLTSLIQTMFPATEEIEISEDGKPVKVKIEGSDGTLQSLTSAAKDILINQLQTIIISKSGSKYDIENEESLAEIGERFQDEYNKQPGWKKLVSFLKWFQSGSADFLLTTEAGTKLFHQLRKFLLTKTIMQRDYLVQLNNFGRLYESKESREALYEVISGERDPKDEPEKKFLHLVKAINRVFGKESQELGVKIYRKDGSFRYFKYSKDSSDTYYPHMWRPEWFRNPTDAMIQSILDSGEATDRAHAKKIIQNFGKQRIRMSKFSNIEMERETDLGGWITDPIEVYTKYVQNASRRLAAIKIFGESPEITLAQFAIRHFKDSKDHNSFQRSKDLINRVLGNRVDNALLKEPAAGMSIGVMYSVGLLLQHSLVVQPGVLANMGAVAGYSNLVKGIASVLPSLWGNQNGKNNKRWAELAGVLAFTVNRELNDIVMEDEHRLKTDKLLRAFGITQMDSALRIVGAITGKLYATDLALRYIEGRNPQDARRLKDLGIDPGKLSADYLQTPQWFAEDLRMAALAFTEDTNFVINPLRSPAFIEGHPLGKVFMLFKNFAFQQHRLVAKMIRDKEFAKLLLLALGSLSFGAAIRLFKTLLKGEDPEKLFEEDGFVKTVWRSFAAGGGAGLFAEAIGNAALGGEGSRTGESPLSLDSPALGLMTQGLKGAGSLYDIAIGDGEQNDLNQLYKTGAMAMQALILSKAPIGIGVPVSAAIGVVRPLSERVIAPSERQESRVIGR